MENRHEPIKLPLDLADSTPFPSRLSREQRGRVMQEIGRLREQLGLIASVATGTGNRAPIDKRFLALRKREHFEYPLKGLENLSRKLKVVALPRNDKQRGETLYALIRLSIAQRIVALVRAEGVTAHLPEPLALHRMEADLDVPLALDRLGDGITPPDLTENPFGNVAPLFKGPHHTFFLQKQTPPPELLKTFVQGIQLAVTTHESMKKALVKGDLFEGHGALSWLESGKKGAMTLYLHILGGLDMYAQAILSPTSGVVDRQLNDFRYPYARNRVFIDPTLSFSDALIAGLKVFHAFTRVSREEFLGGTFKPQAIVATTHNRKRGTLLHHFLPKDPIEFGAAIGRESVMVLEALRRAPLINGGPRFKAPLPHAVAYLRYNAGDIYFLVIVLNLLEKIVIDKTPRPKYAKEEKAALDRLKRGLKDFKQPDKKDVWTVLRRWREEPGSYFLRKRPVARQATLREAIALDAGSLSTQLYGPNERRHMAELNNDGQMNTAEPLLMALTEQDLWDDLRRAMVAHIGQGGKPWLGHSNFLDNIGLRALRFYYMHRGFQEVFQGVDIERERF